MNLSWSGSITGSGISEAGTASIGALVARRLTSYTIHRSVYKRCSKKLGLLVETRRKREHCCWLGRDRMARDANSLIRKGLDLLGDVLEIVADVRERVERAEEPRGAHSSRIASVEEHKAIEEELSTLSTEELHARLAVALAEITDIGDEFARRAHRAEQGSK